MSFDVHPILDAGNVPKKGIWYVITPEGDRSELETREDSNFSPSAGPCPRVGACANFFQSEEDSYGSVLVSAGANPDGPYSDLHKLSFKTDTIQWYTLPSEGFPARYEHASFVVQSLDNGTGTAGAKSLFVFGGAKPEGPVSDVWKYSLDNNLWKEANVVGHIPVPRTYHSGSSMGLSNMVVYSGGDAGTSPVGDQNTYSFDPKSGEWSILETTGSPPSPRQGHVAAVVGNRLFIHGGMAGESILSDLHCLDLESLKWSCPKVTGKAPPPLAAHGCAVLDIVIYIFGGLSLEGPQDILYSLHTDTLTWEEITISGPPPPARLDHAMCSVKIPISRTQTKPASNMPNPTETDNEVEQREREEISLNDDSKEQGTQVLDKSASPRSPQNAGNSVNDGTSSFQAVTVISPDDQTMDYSMRVKDDVISEEMKVLRVENDGCDKTMCEYIPALFLFGGMDASGNIFGDSFVFVP